MQTDFRLILALWGAGLGAAGQYTKISAVFDRLDAHYPEAGVALGFVVSIVGFVGIVLGVVAGLLVARLQYRRALVWALWAGAVTSALQAVLPPLPVMLLLRGLEGISHLAIVVATPTLIAQLSAPQHRGLTLTLWSTFFSVAFTLTIFLGLPLVESHGIAGLFLAHALWMAVFAVILSRALANVQISAPQRHLNLRQILWEHVALYQSPHVAAPAAGWLFYTFCFLAILTVLPPYIDPAIRSQVVGTMPLVSIAVSMTLGVWLLRRVSAVGVVQIGFSLGLVTLAWLWVAPGHPTACLALAAVLGLVQGASFAAVPQLNHGAESQARANGALAQMGNTGNTLGTPVMLMVLSVAGYSGLIATAALGFAGGILAHLWMSWRRRHQAPQDTVS